MIRAIIKSLFAFRLLRVLLPASGCIDDTTASPVLPSLPAIPSLARSHKKPFVNHSRSGQTTVLAAVVVPLLAILAASASGQPVVKVAKDYDLPPEQAGKYQTMVQMAGAKLAASGGREHPLARIERLAHDYAYGSGANKGWDHIRVLARLKADGYELVETLENAKDGMAAIVVKDVRTGGHVIAFRGTDTPFSGGGVDPDAYNDVVESNLAEVGVSQFHVHRSIMDRWAKQYGKDGKLQVTGHSLGGGLAGLFTASHPKVVKKLVTFQAPAQLPASVRRYEQAMTSLPADQRPENVAVIAIDDAVSCAGEIHVGHPKIILTMADDHGLTKAYGHLSYLLQPDNCVTETMNGKAYRDPKDNLFRMTMDYDEYHAFRAVSQLHGSDPLLVKKRKWQDLAEILRISMRDGQMLAIAAGRPYDPTAKKPPLPAVQERIRTLCDDLTDKSEAIRLKYIQALDTLRGKAPSRELSTNYQDEVDVWHEINNNIAALKDGSKSAAKVRAENIALLTKRYRLLRKREELRNPAPAGELMLYVAVRGVGKNVKNVGATVRIAGPSGIFTRGKTGSLFKNLAPGTYRILVTADGFEPARDVVQMSESLPKKRLYKKVSLQPIPNWRPHVGLPPTPGTIQVIALKGPGKKDPMPIYIRISQPEKRYMEGYGWIMRFWNAEPGQYDLAVIASGFQSAVRTVTLTADQIANGYPMFLKLHELQPVEATWKKWDRAACVAAFKAYLDAYQKTLAEAKGYDEKKRYYLERLQIDAYRALNSFPHNETAKLWKAAKTEKKARADEWKKETQAAPRNTKIHWLQILEKDRPRLKAIAEEAKANDAWFEKRFKRIVIPKDDWHYSPGKLFSEMVWGKNPHTGHAPLPATPHPAYWGKPLKYPVSRVPAAMKAFSETLERHDNRRVTIEQELQKARSLKENSRPRIKEMKELAEEVKEMIRRKKEG